MRRGSSIGIHGIIRIAGTTHAIESAALGGPTAARAENLGVTPAARERLADARGAAPVGHRIAAAVARPANAVAGARLPRRVQLRPGAPALDVHVTTARADRTARVSQRDKRTSSGYPRHRTHSKPTPEHRAHSIPETGTVAPARRRSLVNGVALVVQPPAAQSLVVLASGVRLEANAAGGLTITSPRRAGRGHGGLVSALVLALAALPTTHLAPWMRAVIASDVKPLTFATESRPRSAQPPLNFGQLAPPPPSDPALMLVLIFIG